MTRGFGNRCVANNIVANKIVGLNRAGEALEEELGEVAGDIRRDLAERRKGKPRDGGASALDFGTGPG